MTATKEEGREAHSQKGKETDQQEVHNTMF